MRSYKNSDPAPPIMSGSQVQCGSFSESSLWE